MRGIGGIAVALAGLLANEMSQSAAARQEPRKKNIEPPPNKTLPVPDQANWWVDPRKNGKRKSRAMKSSTRQDAGIDKPEMSE